LYSGPTVNLKSASNSMLISPVEVSKVPCTHTQVKHQERIIRNHLMHVKDCHTRPSGSTGGK
jgi:hypothetical protein